MVQWFIQEIFGSGIMNKREHIQNFEINPTENIFLAAVRDHEFLLNHRSSALHISYTSIESRKSNHNNSENSNFSWTANMWVSSSDPSDPLHPTYTARKGDVQAEHLSHIKTALRNTVQNVNFVDSTQMRKAHEALMHDVNR